MPLLPDVLKANMEPFFDQESPNFSAFPADPQDAAKKWAGAVGAYMSGVVPPSATASPAQSTFEATMLGMPPSGGGAAVIVQAFVAAAAQLALGMAPTYISTPPAAPLLLDPVFAIGSAGGSNAAVLSALCTTVDTWMRTGLAVLVAPVPPPPIPWS